MAADLSQEIAAIEAATTVMDSAIVLIGSIPTLIQSAVTAALENGATAVQLQPLADLADALEAKSSALAAAISANTGVEVTEDDGEV